MDPQGIRKMLDHVGSDEPSDGLDAYWIPEGAWLPKPGDRVRVRLSGECRVRGGPVSYQQKHGHLGHPPEEDGIVGVVKSWDSVPSRPGDDLLWSQGHIVLVAFVGRVPCWGDDYHRVSGDVFAPHELELVED